MKSGKQSLIQALVASLLPVAAWGGPVNINTADAATIARELDGIGPSKAQAIVEFRQQNGPFKSVEDLLKVKGIGARMLEQNRSSIQLGKTAAPAQKAAAKQ